MTALPRGVRSSLARQAAAVARRVESDRLYTHEVEELELAVAAYAALSDRLQVDVDLGPLGSPDSRNVVRRVRLRDGREAAVKLIGNGREPGEAEVLAAWRAAGLPCAEPLDWGWWRAPDGAAASYLVTRYVPGRPLERPSSAGARRALAVRLATFIRPFHAANVRLARTRTWQDRLELHLPWTLPLLRARSLPEPAGWHEKLRVVSEQGQAVVHGDPAGANVVERADGSLVLLDPPGSLRAMPEADVGQICAQVGAREDAVAAVDAVCDADPRLDPAAVSLFAGLHFLLTAGWTLAGNPNPDAGAGAADRVGAARDHLAVSATLVDRFALDRRGRPVP